MRQLFVVIVVCAGVIASCGGEASGGDEDAPTSTPTTSQETVVEDDERPEPVDPEPTPNEGIISPGLEALAERAQADLADRLDIASADISVVEARSVVWPDTSIGCPLPGMSYTQVLTDGALVVLFAGDARHEYHIGGSRDLFYCENPTPPTS